MGTRTAVHPRHPHALYAAHGYSPAIVSGDLLFVSGMVGARPDGSPEPALTAQIDLAFHSLHGVLDAAGCSFDDVVDVTLFFIDPNAAMGPALAAMKRAFAQAPPPSVTALGVHWLSGFAFEIKVVARLPKR